jgi:hypothetical protein
MHGDDDQIVPYADSGPLSPAGPVRTVSAWMQPPQPSGAWHKQ